jgi:hypothetical protein
MNRSNASQRTDPSKPPLPTRRWLTPDEAAAYLGKSRRQFDRAKFTASYRLGPGSPMYDVRELDRAMMEAMPTTAERT